MIGSGPIGSVPIAAVEEHSSLGVWAEVPTFIMELVSVVPATKKIADVPSFALAVIFAGSLSTVGPRASTNVLTGSGGPVWDNPDNVKVQDGNAATFNVGAGLASPSLRPLAFGFTAIDNPIRGFQVTARAKAGSANLQLQVWLTKDGNTAVGNTRIFTTNLSTTYTDYIVGSSTDLFDTTWTALDVVSANFGVMIFADNAAGGSSNLASVDYVEVSVHCSLGIVTLKSTNIGPIVMEIITITPDATFESDVGPFVMEFVSLVPNVPALIPVVAMIMMTNEPSTAKVTTILLVSMEFSIIAPAAFSVNQIPIVVMELASITPTILKTVLVSSVTMELVPIVVNASISADLPPVKIDFIGVYPLTYYKVAEVPFVSMVFVGKSPVNFPPIYIGVRSIKGISAEAVIASSGTHILGVD